MSSLNIMILLESSPLKSRILVRRLAAVHRGAHKHREYYCYNCSLYIYIYIYITPSRPRLTAPESLGRRGTARVSRFGASWGAGGSKHFGQFLKIQVLNVLPDHGALNSCMHTFPETNDGFTMVLTHCSMHFETLDLTCCELKSWELTLRGSLGPSRFLGDRRRGPLAHSSRLLSDWVKSIPSGTIARAPFTCKICVAPHLSSTCEHTHAHL